MIAFGSGESECPSFFTHEVCAQPSQRGLEMLLVGEVVRGSESPMAELPREDCAFGCVWRPESQELRH